MSRTGGFLRSTLIWTHERGTLPYDIICALILIFIFLVPNSCFTLKHGSQRSANQATHPAPVTTPAATDSGAAKHPQ